MTGRGKGPEIGNELGETEGLMDTFKGEKTIKIEFQR